MPLLLSAGSAAPFATGPLWEGVGLFFGLFHFGDMINCLADRDRDAVYKSHLSRAVYTLGVGNVAFQIGATALVSIGLAVHLAWILDRWLLLALVLVGLAIGAAYSVGPIHFKRRGLGQLVSLWVVIFVLPMTIAELLVAPRPSLALFGVSASYATLQMGVILVNTAEDYPEDLAAGMRNTIVALGLTRGITLAAGLVAVGGLGFLAAMAGLFLGRSGGPSGPWLIPLAVLAAVWLFVLSGVVALRRRVGASDLEGAIAAVKASGKWVPVWVTLGAWAGLACSATLFWYRLRDL